MDATTVDHIIPVAKGGTDDPENLVAACRRCNFSKQDKMPDEYWTRSFGAEAVAPVEVIVTPAPCARVT